MANTLPQKGTALQFYDHLQNSLNKVFIYSSYS
jgi:hypothetical protein